jgi:hypothetical protein
MIDKIKTSPAGRVKVAKRKMKSIISLRPINYFEITSTQFNV